MQENFRQFLGRLRDANELIDLHQPVDIRHIATLVDQSDKALLFHNVIGYSMPVVSGIIRSRYRAIMSMGVKTYGEIETKLKKGIDNPIPPRYVETAKHKAVVLTGDEVDLFKLPIPMSSIYDGGPMITAGVVISNDEEYGLNTGIYRFMVKEKNLTGIDIVTPNNMRMYAQRAYEAGRPCPISTPPWMTVTDPSSLLICTRALDVFMAGNCLKPMPYFSGTREIPRFFQRLEALNASTASARSSNRVSA